MSDRSTLTVRLVSEGCAPRVVRLPSAETAPYLDDATAIPVLRRMHEPERPRQTVFGRLVTIAFYAGLLAMAYGAAEFAVWSVSLFTPGRIAP